MSDRVACARCGAEIWWWAAWVRIGDPETPYCSRPCATHPHSSLEGQRPEHAATAVQPAPPGHDTTHG